MRTAGVTSLVIFDLVIGDEDFAALGRLRCLTWLNIHNANVTDKGLEGIKNLKSLYTLQLADIKGKGIPITGEGFRELQGLSELHSLSLHRSNLSDEGMAQIVRLPKLDSLTLETCKVSDAGLAHIPKLTKLQFLILRGAQVTGTGFRGLVLPEKVRALNVGSCPITDEGVAAMTDLKVVTLELSGTKVTDAAASSFAKFPNLTTLELVNTSVTEASLDSFAKIPGLTKLHLPAGPKMSRERIEALKKERPKLAVELYDANYNQVKLD
jgi:hypothetical protein